MDKKYFFIVCFILLSTSCVFAQQEFSLFHQFNGKYDFTFVGNTMNYTENGVGVPCVIQTSSSAELDLPTSYQIEKVYLYWSGSGTGDFEVNLNDNIITSDREYNLTYVTSDFELNFFVAVTDVTDLIQTIGNGTYTLSGLDVSQNFIPPSPYCSTSTNYAGWTLIIVYKDENIPLNQLNLYEGLKNVPEQLSITLENLNVIDNEGAKIGFVAWEGDAGLAVGETLRINNNVISNPPLNPANNAFNGTNSITGSTTLYNMDLDVYDIQNNIQIGDTSAEITLSSGQDLVMISTVLTKLNSQLPDATIVFNRINTHCGATEIEVEYTVFNINSTEILPSQTPIAVYINGILVGTSQTNNEIPIGGSEDGVIYVVLPEEINEIIEIKLVVDDIGDGSGIVTEINENNNSQTINFELMLFPKFIPFEDLTACNIGHKTAVFDFSEFEMNKVNDSDILTFYNSYEDAELPTNAISNTSAHIVQNEFPKEIFVRIDNDNCYSITSFFLHIRNCPPTIYNGVSVNDDGVNDVFYIEGLYDIFEDFELFIYSRWGELLWTGNSQRSMWDGTVTEKKAILNKKVPEGTYFYVLYLNDKDYPKPFTGYLYLTK